MAWPPRVHCESQGSDEDVSPAKKHGAAPPKKKQPARPTINAIRIPADGSPPHLTTLQLIDATPSYDFSLKKLYDSKATACRRVGLPPRRLEHHHQLHNTSHGDRIRLFPDLPLAATSENPWLTFTHAGLRFQPNVADPFWKSREAWRNRAFQRLYAFPREDADLDMMTGEYHIMYTYAAARDLRLNQRADCRLSGDAFVLKMASGKDEDGDWYYEDVPQEILHCSLKDQCMETLKSLRPNS